MPKQVSSQGSSKEYVQTQDLDAEGTGIEAKALDITTFKYGHLPAITPSQPFLFCI